MKELSTQLNEERANKQSVQEALAFGIARFSPSACFSLAAATLAGTSLGLKEHYRNAAMDYQQTYAKFILEKTGVNPGGGMVFRMMTDNGEKPKPINPQELPPFVYQPPMLADLCRRRSWIWDFWRCSGSCSLQSLMLLSCDTTSDNRSRWRATQVP